MSDISFVEEIYFRSRNSDNTIPSFLGERYNASSFVGLKKIALTNQLTSEKSSNFELGLYPLKNFFLFNRS